MKGKVLFLFFIIFENVNSKFRYECRDHGSELKVKEVGVIIFKCEKMVI